MAFSWISITAGVTIGLDDHLNEVKSNVDTLADNLGIAQYTWSNMPVGQYDKITKLQVQELQDAIDYIDGENWCSAENAGHDDTANPSDESTEDIGEHSSDESSKEDAQLGTQKATDNGSKYTPYNSGYDSPD